MMQPLKRTILIKNAVIYTLNAKDEVVRGNILVQGNRIAYVGGCLLNTSPSPRD